MEDLLLHQDVDWWVMNVVPISGPNTLPVIFNRGLIGVAIMKSRGGIVLISRLVYPSHEFRRNSSVSFSFSFSFHFRCKLGCNVLDFEWHLAVDTFSRIHDLI